jgi:hypothetical protein
MALAALGERGAGGEEPPLLRELRQAVEPWLAKDALYRWRRASREAVGLAGLNDPSHVIVVWEEHEGSPHSCQHVLPGAAHHFLQGQEGHGAGWAGHALCGLAVEPGVRRAPAGLWRRQPDTRCLACAKGAVGLPYITECRQSAWRYPLGGEHEGVRQLLEEGAAALLDAAPRRTTSIERLGPQMDALYRDLLAGAMARMAASHPAATLEWAWSCLSPSRHEHLALPERPPARLSQPEAWLEGLAPFVPSGPKASFAVSGGALSKQMRRDLGEWAIEAAGCAS